MRREVITASAVAFIASFCTLVIELVAGRIMAPYVGQSLYTWTSIIGVVLAGISLGAYIGGLLADRFPRPSTLGWLLFFSGLASFAIAPLADMVGGSRLLEGQITLMMRIFFLTTVIFFVPALILGMISPVVVRLTVQTKETAGNVVGKIYAFSTLGSIIGTFATGFFLIEAMGTRTILYGVGGVLVLCAPIFGGLLSSKRGGPREAVIGASLIGMAATLGLLWWQREAIARPLQFYFDDYSGEFQVVSLTKDTFYKESDYYAIKIYQDNSHGVPLKTLVLDHLIHSYTHPEDPSYLQYDYLRIYEELVAWHRTRKPDADKYLFVGGGGYTLPRYFDHNYADAKVDVVEIDPWVTRVAEEQLGVQGTRIRSFNEDGRWWVMNCKDQYDFIFGDAFNDLSIPYHLTTKEFDADLKRILKPDGLLMCLVIDNIGRGQFLPTYIRTLQEVFGTDNVYLLTFYDKDPDEIGSHTCIVLASPSKLDMKGFESFLAQRLQMKKRSSIVGLCMSVGTLAVEPLGLQGVLAPGLVMPRVPVYNSAHVVDPDRLRTYMADRKAKTGREPIVLTDDYVPVDNLVAPMFEERFGYKKDQGGKQK